MSDQLSPQQLDAMAQQRGFPDYQTWVAWHRHYRSVQRGPGQVQPQQQKNWLQNLVDQIPIHPSSILNYVNDKFRGATENRR